MTTRKEHVKNTSSVDMTTPERSVEEIVQDMVNARYDAEEVIDFILQAERQKQEEMVESINKILSISHSGRGYWFYDEELPMSDYETVIEISNRLQALTQPNNPNV